MDELKSEVRELLEILEYSFDSGQAWCRFHFQSSLYSYKQRDFLNAFVRKYFIVYDRAVSKLKLCCGSFGVVDAWMQLLE